MSFKKKNRNIILIILLSFALSGLFYYSFQMQSGVQNSEINDALFRFRYQFLGKNKITPKIAIIALTDNDIRNKLYNTADWNMNAKMVRILTQMGISSALYDIIFLSGRTPNSDTPFVNSIKDAGNIYFPVILDDHLSQYIIHIYRNQPDENDISRIIWNVKTFGNIKQPEMVIALSTFKDVAVSAKGLGHINAYIDSDKVHRRIPLVLSVENGVIPSIAFAAVCDFLMIKTNNIEINYGKEILLKEAKLPSGLVKDIHIPIDEKGQMVLNFPGPWANSFTQYSFSDILEADTNSISYNKIKETLQGSIVIIANASQRGRDLGAISLEKRYPLNGLHATVINSIINEDFISIHNNFIIFLNLFFILILIFACLYLKPLKLFIASIFIYIAFIVANIVIFVSLHTLVYPLLFTYGFITALLLQNFYLYLEYKFEYAKLQISLEKQFPSNILSGFLGSQKQLLKPRTKYLTILFCSLHSFTNSCKSKDPEIIQSILNEYIDLIAGIVFDVMLALILGLVVYTVSSRDISDKPVFFDYLNFALILTALGIDMIALSAIVIRLSSFGISANKTAALGENIVLIINLGGLAYLYMRYFIQKKGFNKLVKWQTSYLTVIAVWSTFVSFIFPFIFGFQ